jgi:hypothetical protein
MEVYFHIFDVVLVVLVSNDNLKICKYGVKVNYCLTLNHKVVILIMETIPKEV